MAITNDERRDDIKSSLLDLVKTGLGIRQEACVDLAEFGGHPVLGAVMRALNALDNGKKWDLVRAGTTLDDVSADSGLNSWSRRLEHRLRRSVNRGLVSWCDPSQACRGDHVRTVKRAVRTARLVKRENRQDRQDVRCDAWPVIAGTLYGQNASDRALAPHVWESFEESGDAMRSYDVVL